VVKVLLVLATVVDLALAALLIGVSGFFFGGGPEGMHGAFWPVAGWTAMLIACLVGPVAGFIFNGRGKTGAGVLVAWLPLAGALLALMIPAPY
jgi:hypothetical protein